MPDSLTSILSSYYDTVPYDSHPFPQTAPEHLETLSFLFGLDAPAPAKSRVLELGCAAGGNVIPFAARHPEASVLGVDLSSVQVAQGVQAVEQAQLENIELRTANIADIDASFGQFDYIICHGVYSWVPGPVQDAILRVCSENLTANGVAYVSYNVYPGWKAREIVRDAMILRGGPRDSPEEKLSYARGMLEFLEESARQDSVLKKTLEETMPIVHGGNNSYLLHEFLEPCNAPCYFKEFVARAESHGLTYLCEAEPSTMFAQNYGEKVREPLLRECGGSQVMTEQYLDFLVNRTFRQTLLVKKERASEIRYRLDISRIKELEFAGVFATEDGSELSLDASEQSCKAMRDIKITLRQPVQKAVARVLDESYPASVSTQVLISAAAKMTGEPLEAVESTTLAMLEELLILGALRMRRTSTVAASKVPAMPQALESVRRVFSASSQSQVTNIACNQWHESVGLSTLECSLLPRLDGTQSHKALAEHLLEEVRAKRLQFIKDAKPMTKASKLDEFAQQQVASALKDLKRKALLLP